MHYELYMYIVVVYNYYTSCNRKLTSEYHDSAVSYKPKKGTIVSSTIDIIVK